MPITDEYVRLPLAEIAVYRGERQRREVSTKGLIDSIRIHGVLNPIIVRREGMVLVAGERRYAASQELGLEDIPVRFAEDLSETEASILELEENIKRSDLPWQDLVRAVGQIHELYRSRDEEWTAAETADACALSPSTISIYLRVFGVIDDEKIVAMGTIREAYNVLARRDQRAMGNALEELLGAGDELVPAVSAGMSAASATGDALISPSPPTANLTSTGTLTRVRSFPSPADCILHESFLHWAPKYTGRKFNLIHCDFPYGIGLFAGPQAGGDRHDTQYDDSEQVYVRLLGCLCKNLPKLMSVSGHLLFWYSEKHRDLTQRMFSELAPDLRFQPYPLIWLKSDNAGIASDPRNGPRHVYETCLMATRGVRNVVKLVADGYSAPTDKRFHVSTKPEPMLRHFMSMLVDESTEVLDPTCGGGSALRAAESLGAKRILGMDVDETTVGTARMALGQSRTLRSF